MSQRIIHRRYESQRWPIINALWNAADEKLQKRGRRLGLCCAVPTLRTRGGTSVHAALQRCRDRMCPFCATKRGKVAAAKTIALTAGMNAPRFATLTTAANKRALKERLQHLLTSFAKLRLDPWWRSVVKGGIFAIEVKWNAKLQSWHPHLHLIIDGEYLPQPKLKALWQKITGDSFIVDVRAVPDRAKAARYIAAYVAKPAEVQSWPAERIREYAETLHGARMIQTFGCCHKINADADDEPEVQEPSRHLIHGSQLTDAMAKGSKAAGWAREVFARLGIEAAAAVGIRPEPNAPRTEPPQDWELRAAVVVASWVHHFWPNLPASFDATFAPERVISACLEAAGAPADVASCSTEQRCSCGDEDSDPLLLFADPDIAERLHEAADR